MKRSWLARHLSSFPMIMLVGSFMHSRRETLQDFRVVFFYSYIYCKTIIQKKKIVLPIQNLNCMYFSRDYFKAAYDEIILVMKGTTLIPPDMFSVFFENRIFLDCARKQICDFLRISSLFTYSKHFVLQFLQCLVHEKARLRNHPVVGGGTRIEGSDGGPVGLVVSGIASHFECAEIRCL